LKSPHLWWGMFTQPLKKKQKRREAQFYKVSRRFFLTDERLAGSVSGS